MTGDDRRATPSDADAIVIGAGPNGLVAANVLADAGWRVVVLETNAEPGGAVRTAEVTAPGFRNDLFSAFYPLAAASPAIRKLELERFGLRWTHAPAVLAHPLPDAAAAVLHPRLEQTVAGLDAEQRGDGQAFGVMFDEFLRIRNPLLEAMLGPFPPVRAALGLARRSGPAGIRDLVRLGLLPLRQFVDERFAGDHAALLLAGCALHADLTPEAAGSALFGWLLLCVAQDVGFPVPVGGAGEITAALVRRLEDRGGSVSCGQRVTQVVVRGGRAVGVRTACGAEISARHAVLADCDVTRLLLELVGEEHLPGSAVRRLSTSHRGAATFKVDWALSGPVPWSDATVREAGTVHVADSLDELSITSSELARGLVPADPFLLIGQMTTADATRSPIGTEALWAYTHVPQRIRGDAGRGDGPEVRGTWDSAECDELVERMERRIEAFAPGFRDRIMARHVMSPRTLEAMDANLVGGDINGGTAQLHQQLVFRPVSGWARAETPIPGLYLASSSAHPGGGVHGACGANAARAAILHRRLSWARPGRLRRASL